MSRGSSENLSKYVFLMIDGKYEISLLEFRVDFIWFTSYFSHFFVNYCFIRYCRLFVAIGYKVDNFNDHVFVKGLRIRLLKRHSCRFGINLGGVRFIAALRDILLLPKLFP